MTESESKRGGMFAILGLTALAWCAVAFIAQVIVITTVVPRLPQRVLIYLPGRTGGNGHLAPGTADLVVICWVVIAVFTVAAIAALLFRSRAWAIGTSVFVCAGLPSVGASVITSLLWQVGRTSPAESVPPEVGTQVWLAFIIFLVLGFGSSFLVPRWIGRSGIAQA